MSFFNSIGKMATNFLAAVDEGEMGFGLETTNTEFSGPTEWECVWQGGVNVRESPSTNAESIDSLECGEKVIAVEVDGYWIRHAKGWTCTQFDRHVLLRCLGPATDALETKGNTLPSEEKDSNLLPEDEAVAIAGVDEKKNQVEEAATSPEIIPTETEESKHNNVDVTVDTPKPASSIIGTENAPNLLLESSLPEISENMTPQHSIEGNSEGKDAGPISSLSGSLDIHTKDDAAVPRSPEHSETLEVIQAANAALQDFKFDGFQDILLDEGDDGKDINLDPPSILPTSVETNTSRNIQIEASEQPISTPAVETSSLTLESTSDRNPIPQMEFSKLESNLTYGGELEGISSLDHSEMQPPEPRDPIPSPATVVDEKRDNVEQKIPTLNPQVAGPLGGEDRDMHVEMNLEMIPTDLGSPGTSAAVAATAVTSEGLNQPDTHVDEDIEGKDGVDEEQVGHIGQLDQGYNSNGYGSNGSIVVVDKKDFEEDAKWMSEPGKGMVQDLQAELEAVQKAHMATLKEVEDLKKAEFEMKETLSRTELELGNSRSQYQSVMMHANESMEELEREREIVRSLTKEKTSLEQKLANAVLQTNEALEQANRLQDENTILESKLDLQAENMQKEEDVQKISEDEGTISKHLQTIEALQQKVKDLENELEEARTAASGSEGKLQTISNMQIKIQDLEGKLKTSEEIAEEHLNTVNEQLREIGIFQNEVRAAKTELKETKRKLENYEQVVEQSEQGKLESAHVIAELRRSLQESEETLSEKKRLAAEEIQDLRLKITELEDNAHSKEEHEVKSREEITALEQIHNDLNAKADELEKALALSKKESELYIEKFENARKVIDTLQRQNTDSSETILELRTGIETLTNQLNGAMQSMEELKEKGKRELETLKGEYERVQEEMKEMARATEAQEDIEAKIQASVQASELKLKRAYAIKEREWRARMRTQLANREQRIKDNAITEANEALESKIETLEAELVALRENRNMPSTNLSMNDKDEISNFTAEIALLQNKLADMNRSQEILSSDLEKLTFDLKKETQIKTALEYSLRSSNEQIEELQLKLKQRDQQILEGQNSGVNSASELTRAETTIDLLSSQLEEKEAKLSNNVELMNEEKLKRTELEEKLENVLRKLELSNSKLLDAEAGLQLKEKALMALTQQMTSLHEEMASRDEMQLTNSQDQEAVDEKIRAFEAQIQSLSTQVEGMRAEVKTSKQKEERAVQSFRKALVVVDKLKKKVATLNQIRLQLMSKKEGPKSA
mmetsp:Transcript_15877/g.23931  ORF Transcript_15877/g.23931 Transcript_15877/m.23931 type:complete len:1261 (+) Transcript_15877:85-3867(+)